jgi:hypothetical protein
MHFGYEDFPSVVVDANKNSFLRLTLKRLLKELRNALSDEPFSYGTTRINLLYQNPEDELEVNINPNSFRSVLNTNYDFFVSANGRDHKRFTNRRRGRFFFNGQRINTQKVSDVFGDADSLELTYLSSVGAKCFLDGHFYPRDDFSVVYLWQKHQDEKFKQELVKGLEEKICDIDKLLGMDLPHLLGLRIMSVVPAARDCSIYEPSALFYSDLLTELQGDGYCCPCLYSERYADFTDLLDDSIDALITAGFLVKSKRFAVEDEFWIPEEIEKPLKPVIPKEQLALF